MDRLSKQSQSEEEIVPSGQKHPTKQKLNERHTDVPLSGNGLHEEDLNRQFLHKCLQPLAVLLGFTFLLMICYLWLQIL